MAALATVTVEPISSSSFTFPARPQAFSLPPRSLSLTLIAFALHTPAKAASQYTRYKTRKAAMFSSLLSFALVSLALPYAALASHGAANHRRHEAIAAAQHNVTDAVETTLHRRGQTYNNARLTYYAVGL